MTMQHDIRSGIGREFGPVGIKRIIIAIYIAVSALLDHHGTVLAVGAILKIEGGSRGGGRLAAAQAAGKLGLGITVSQDGGILGFRDTRSKPEFAVMT